MNPNTSILDNVQKRAGAGGALEGFIYEIKIIFLFMIRACLNNVKFKLVSNVDGFGNFDDLVAECELEDGTEFLICLQSKHLKESDNKIDLNRLKGKKYIKGKEKYTDDKSFKLQNYRDSIILKSETKESKIKESKISNYKDVNVKLIFYTTVAISETDTDLQWCDIDNNDILCSLLNTSAGNNCVRRFSDTGNTIILREIENDKTFLDKICIFSNQRNESDFDEILKIELEKLLGTENVKINNKIFAQLKDVFLPLYKTVTLFDNNKFLNIIWDIVSQELSWLGTERNFYETLSKDYKHNNMALLKKYIKDNQIVTVKTYENSTVLPAIEVYKAVSDITQQCVRKPVFVKLQNLRQVLILFENIIDYLIIEVDLKCVNKFRKDLEMLYKILGKKKCKKSVFVISNPEGLNISLQNDKIVDYMYTFDFKSLCPKTTQNNILKCNIKFQGNVMPLSGIIDRTEACSILDYETVEKLIKNETVNIGEEMKKLPKEIEYCYIKRSFHCTHVVSSKIFDMESNSDVLLVSVTSEYHLRKYKRDFVHYKDIDENNKISGIFYHISFSEKRDKKVFKHFAAKLQEKNVHWLQEKENNLVWLDTKGSVENIQKYVQTCTLKAGKMTQQGSSEDILLERENKLNVLLDAAGKGKTTTLYKIAEQLKLKNKNCWVLHYDLNSTQMHDILYNMSEDKNFEKMDVKELVLKYFLTKCTPFEESVFNLLFKKSKIYFCFDGLDEISPRYENIFIALVKKLNQSSTKQIWLTSREHMEKSLQNNFPVFPIKLLDISFQDRVYFCVKYYTFELNIDETNKKKIEQFSKALIGNLSSVNATILEFMGIPLLTKMLASINVEQCRKYLNNTHEKANLPMTLKNIFDLYQTFFENAVIRYFTEKESKDLKDPRLFLKEKIKKFQKLHMSIATKSLLPERYSKLITEQGEADRLTADQETKLLGIGIITSLETDNAKFLHFTFAEFMLAYSIIQEKNLLQLQNILDEVLYNYSWEVVRKFLNSSNSLAANLINIKYNPTTKYLPDDEDTSLTIALEEENRNIAQCMLQCLRGVDEADAKTWICRRTNRVSGRALFTAIDKGYEKEVSLILDIGVNIEEDTLLFSTPLIHAVRQGNPDIISLLARGTNIHQRNKFNDTAILEAAIISTPEVLDLLLAKGASLEDKDDDVSLLMCAAQNIHHDMLVHVLGKRKWDVNYKDSQGDTALHIAAYCAHSLNIKTLLDHGADIDSLNNRGETILHLAVNSLHYPENSTQGQLCVKYLIKRGATTDITDKGKTALDELLTRPEFKNLMEWIEKDSVHDSIDDLEQQLKNSDSEF